MLSARPPTGRRSLGPALVGPNADQFSRAEQVRLVQVVKDEKSESHADRAMLNDAVSIRRGAA
ncbi:hypothetical protein SALB1_3548 [Salinisphaera sp. LB1]|nr:hypothetical protein SALB1_3548 [Salinisphaera sp. LB1]